MNGGVTIVVTVELANNSIVLSRSLFNDALYPTDFGTFCKPGQNFVVEPRAQFRFYLLTGFIGEFDLSNLNKKSNIMRTTTPIASVVRVL